MANKVPLMISEEIRERLKTMGTEAAEGGLSPDMVAEILLNAFLDGHGKIYTARWKEGPGIRILPDWPRFSSGIFKIKLEDMK